MKTFWKYQLIIKLLFFEMYKRGIFPMSNMQTLTLEEEYMKKNMDPFDISIELTRTVNYAMYQNDVPIVNRLVIINNTNNNYENVILRITASPEFCNERIQRFDIIKENQTMNLGSIDLKLSNEYLFNLNERIKGNLLVEIFSNEEKLYTSSFNIEVLAVDEWNGLSIIPEILAAFILPNNKVIESLMTETSDILKEWTGDSSISGYQTHNPKRVLAIVSAIYQAIQNQDIKYINPPASFQDEGQKVRLPSRIINNRIATCLDISLLAAGCIEQAGLNPLIILTNGHAFTGFWLSDETFSNSVVDDCLKVKKRVELKEICLIETTLLTSDNPIDFERSVNVGKNRIQDENDFICAIDVKRSRKSSRILPLPIGEGVNSEQGDKTIISIDEQESSIPSLDQFLPVEEITDTPETSATRLDRWKRKLLDLSLRNRLLNFRETKKSISLYCPEIPILEDILADGEKFQVLPKPEQFDKNQTRKNEIHQERTGNDLKNEFLTNEFKYRRLYSDLTPAELNRRTIEIYRAAKLSLEENGANTLFLALGFLEWYETELSEKKRIAPIILLPLEINRKSVLEGFTINQSDEDSFVNITLLELLNKDKDLKIEGLDPIPLDDHGIDVPLILNKFRQAIKKIDRWKVINEAKIGMFSFSKFLMWKDLESRSEELKKNNLVEHLIETPQEAYKYNSNFPDIEKLDDNYRLTETFCPMGTDSSQLAAVYSAQEKKTFVLQGPPGTGKSQTITNIIANSLANGLRVLFVAEKMAALNVVNHRLQLSGLGEFCLELHSNKSHKRSVINQLGNVLKTSSSNTSQQWLNKAEKLEKLRFDLNQYVRSLHKVREINESIYQGISKLIHYSDQKKINLNWPIINIRTAKDLEEKRSILKQIQHIGKEIGHPSVNIWKASQKNEWSHKWKNRVETLLEETLVEAENLLHIAEKTCSTLKLENMNLDLNSLNALKKIITLLLKAKTTPEYLLTVRDWESAKEEINVIIKNGRNRDSLKNKLFNKYSNDLLKLDLNMLLKTLNEAEMTWFIPKWYKKWTVRNALNKVTNEHFNVEYDDMFSDVSNAIMFIEEVQATEKKAVKARQMFGKFWNNGFPDWNELESITKYFEEVRRTIKLLAGFDFELESLLREKWAFIISEAETLLSRGGKINILFNQFISLNDSFREKLKAIEAALELNRISAWNSEDHNLMLEKVITQLKVWIENTSLLKAWTHWRSLKKKAEDHQLEKLINCYEQNELKLDSLLLTFNYNFYKWWVEKTIDSEPVLRNFYSSEFTRMIIEFRKLDKEYIELTKNEIIARLLAKVPNNKNIKHNKNSEMGILYNQLGRKKGHMPIRKLFQKIPNILPLLKPCLLMSPLSVAQYLDPSFPNFDIVIFDEASQISTWEAVGAIARGDETIVVGDPKQLPPTNFFNKINEAEENDEEEIFDDQESILDDLLAARVHKLDLKWHYRSVYESLISFSNYSYYDNRLLTFPSPYHQKGVSFRYVNGTYDKGKSRSNKKEAYEIVYEILKRIKDPNSTKSIGVVTFSIAQQTLIEDLLDDAKIKQPDIEKYFNSESEEPIFVKNLENVQGDEREVIMMSICYGPDSNKKISMNFGPLNKEGGERRLNVAITRARREVIVFSSIRAQNIDLSRTKSTGVKDLKYYLDFAERGQKAIDEICYYNPEGECESYFEEKVLEELLKLGYTAHPQVGCSGYRIDLGIVDPDDPGRYLLGIECDGANYHRAKTARDRDRLRESVLRKLGWQIHRIWSTDWWENSEKEIDKIKDAIEKAKLNIEKPIVKTEELVVPKIEEKRTMKHKEDVKNNNSNVIERIIKLPEYQVVEIPKTNNTPESFYDFFNESYISKQLQAIVNKEGPISLNLISRRIAESWNINRVTQRVKRRIIKIIKKTDFYLEHTEYEKFLWPSHLAPENYNEFRIPPQKGENPRAITDFSPKEIKNAVLYLLENSISIPKDDLMKETAKLFGFQRMGNTITQIIGKQISLLLESKLIEEQNDFIVLKN